MTLLGNLLWIILGGFAIFLFYLVGGLVLCCTIVGIPFGLQCFKLSWIGLAPFGKEIRDSESASGCLFVILNLIWLVCAGLWIAVLHLIAALLLAITIIGIPFATQHIKLIPVALLPFGKQLR